MPGMGRFYSVVFEAVSVPATNAMDLFEITPADDKPIALVGLTLDNVGGIADAGDAQEELLQLAVRRGYGTSGSGGSAPTPRALRSGDAAAGFTAEVNNTTVATAGTAINLKALGWNVRVPLREFWPEELWPGVSQADTMIVVRLVVGPADAVSVSGTLYVAEFV